MNCFGLHDPRPAPWALGLRGPLADPAFKFLVQLCQFLDAKVLHPTHSPTAKALGRPMLRDAQGQTTTCGGGVALVSYGPVSGR
jgi:hypothetical protein